MDFFSFHSIKTEQEAVHFGENSITKSAFHENKKSININEVDIKRIALSDKKSLCKDSNKFFIGFRHEGNAFPSPLCLKLPQMKAYVKYFDKNSKYINHLVKDEKLLTKYLKIWNRIKSLIKKELISEPVYNDKYIEIKIRIYNDKVYKNFQHNKIPEDNEYFACLTVILLDSILLTLIKNIIRKYF